ncbi:MAG: porin [Longimicrobiales bacterium]
MCLFAPALHAQTPADSTVRLIGRVQLDGATYAGADKPMSNGVDLRRVRLGASGTLDGAWRFQVELDMGEGEVEVKDAWFERTVRPGLAIRAGAFKEPFSLEELTSSRFTTFMERGLPNAFAPGRSLGVAATAHVPAAWMSVGLFGQEADELGESEIGEAEGWAVTGRAVARRWREDGGIQVGLSATRRTPDAREGGGDRVRYRSYPEAKIDRTRFLNTGHIKKTLHHRTVGLEGLAVWGPLSVQAERIGATVTREDGTASLGGSYVTGSWFVTGERRRYDPAAAELAEVAPRGGIGAVELALRYSHLDLDDPAADVAGGEATQWTMGATWHMTSRVQWSVNHVWIDNGADADADGDWSGDDDFRVLTTRLQIWF